MAVPTTYLIGELRGLAGKAHVTFPTDKTAQKRVERVLRVPKDGWEMALGTADAEHTDAHLVSQQKLKEDGQYVEVYRAWEVLPGEWIPFTRYDDQLGPVQGRRRAVLNTGQEPTLTATGKTTYEGRDGSAYVLWEIEENWSDGTGSEGNPAYPEVFRSFNDPLRGPVKEWRKIVAKTGSEEASRAESGGTVTTIEYEPYNEYLLTRVTQTFELSGPLQAGQAITTQFGGGVLDTKRQYVEDGTALTGNFRRVGGEVQPDGQGGSVLQTSDLPPDEDWPTLVDEEYDSTLKGFIKTAKTVVEDLDQSGSATGGSGTDRVVTEYRGLDKWRRIQIVSRIPSAIIGATQTFKKTINFSLPNEIRVEPVVVRAFAQYLPSKFMSQDFQEVYMDAITSDVGLDWQIHKGKSGPFVCNVSRTISTSSSAPEVALEFDDRAERICVPINRPSMASVSKMAGKILEFTFPEALHGYWNFAIANMFTPTGLWVRDTPEDTETLLTDPVDIQNFFANLEAGNGWRTAFTNDPVYVTRDATSPDEVPKDTPFILAMHSEEWRYGLWVHDVYRYTLTS